MISFEIVYYSWKYQIYNRDKNHLPSSFLSRMLMISK